ncbi:MAG: hypothetical protein ACREP9_14240 [Candidatus Dormibacteraceae bacterium]
METGLYFIRNEQTDKVLSSDGEGNIYTDNLDTNRNQAWWVKPGRLDAYVIVYWETVRALDSNAAGDVHTNSENDESSQRWKLEAAS